MRRTRFFAISQLAGGVPAPALFGYLIGAVVMFAGGLIAWFFGVNAERKSLEDIATPLSVVTRAVGGAGAAAST